MSVIYRAINKVHWKLTERKLQSVGKKIHIDVGFKFKNSQYIKIGSRVSVGKNFIVEAWDEYCGIKTGRIPFIIIGDDVSFMSNCQLSAALGITIGNGVLFGDNVFVTDNFHGENKRTELDIPPAQRSLHIKGEVIIGDNVWLGRNVCIMPGVTIGTGAVIGANAVVTKNIPAYAIAVGVPAEVIEIVGE